MTARTMTEGRDDSLLQVFRVSSPEFRMLMPLMGQGIPAALAGLAGGGDTESDQYDEKVTRAQLVARGLIAVADDGTPEVIDELWTALDCMLHPALSAMVLADTDVVRVTALLAAGEHLVALSREPGGVVVRLTSSNLLGAVIAMLTGLQSARCSMVDSSPVVIAELDGEGFDAENLTVSPEFEGALEHQIEGRARVRSVAISVRGADDSINRASFSWVADEHDRVFEVRRGSRTLRVETSDPDRLMARVMATLGGWPMALQPWPLVTASDRGSAPHSGFGATPLV